MIWRVLEHGSSSVKFIVYQDLLDKAARLLPSGVKVVFLADRGFVDHQLLRHLRYYLELALSHPPQVQLLGVAIWQRLAAVESISPGERASLDAPKHQTP